MFLFNMAGAGIVPDRVIRNEREWSMVNGERSK